MDGSWLVILQVLLLLFANKATLTWAGFGVPGTTQTISGYDTELGTDAVCRKSQGIILSGEEEAENGMLELPNALIDHYYLDGQVELLQACPEGNTLTASAPIEYQQNERLRTGHTYVYGVDVTINLNSLSSAGTPEVMADKDNFKGPYVAVQVLLCALGEVGFCSPYIHEAANARLVAMNQSTFVDMGDRHGGTHVHSGYQLIELPPEKGPVYEFHVDVPMLLNHPGNFFAVASLELYLKNTIVRYDMANAMIPEHRLIDYQDPAQILQVPEAVRIVSYVAIALVSGTILFLLGQTIRHRNHQILQLTQGYFLVLFLLAALVASVFCFTLDPRRDVYCQISHPILLSSLQLMYAVTWGRLWRINSVISPLLLQTIQASQSTLVTTRFMRIMNRLIHSTKEDNSSMLRRTISAAQLAQVVAIFTLPQVVLQILAVWLQPSQKIIDFNDDESIGREVCEINGPAKYSLQVYGYAYFFLLIALLMALAHATQHLPSLFNETRVIFESTLATIALLILAIGIQVVTDDSTTSPGLSYMILMLLILSTTLNTTLRIMVPKLRMVWSGEKIVVSKLVSDDRNRNSSPSMASSWTSGHGYSNTARKLNFSDTSGVSHSIVGMENLSNAVASHASEIETLTNNPDSMEGQVEAAGLQTIGHAVASRPLTTVQFEEADLPTKGNKQLDSNRTRVHVKIETGQAPSRKLVLKMFNLQNELARVNERICSGLGVAEDDWRKVRSLSTSLGTFFSENVDFAWETSKSSSLESSDLNGERRSIMARENSAQLETDPEEP